MIFKIITLYCIAAFVYSLKKESIYAKIINGLIVLGFVSFWIGIYIYKSPFLLSGLIVVLTGMLFLSTLHFCQSEIRQKHRYLHLTIFLLAIQPVLFIILHLPFQWIGGMLSIIPLTYFLKGLFKREYKNSSFMSGFLMFVPICLTNLIYLVIRSF